MGKKRSRDEESSDVEKKVKRLEPSMIKNKMKRGEVYAKLKHEKKMEKKKRHKSRDAAEKRALELGEEPPKPKVPRTIENTRESDETVCRPDDEERGNHLIAELLSIIPNATYYKRGTYELKKIVEYANNRDFTCIVVTHENRREPNGMLIINLPDGPTAQFKLSSLVLRKKIKNHGRPTSHLPELILNNFTTRLGHRVGRMFATLFPQDPDFRGRRVVTFHNQRDFIFFRHHRYIFETKEAKVGTPKGKVTKNEKDPQKETVGARLQECGPRFTLKLISLQHGTFDTRGGEYEWVHKPDMDTSRRRFFL